MSIEPPLLLLVFLGLCPCARPYSRKKSHLSEAHTDNKEMTRAISGMLCTPPVHVCIYSIYNIQSHNTSSFHPNLNHLASHFQPPPPPYLWVSMQHGMCLLTCFTKSIML